MNNINWITAIESVISLVLFVILAYVFKKWWIVFFALLFMLYFRIFTAIPDNDKKR